MEIKYFKISNFKIRYLQINSEAKDWLVFLHGWGGSLDSWQAFLKQFESQKINVLAFDLPGFGQSSLPPQAWDISAYANFVKMILDHFGIKYYYLFGHSFGGQIALKLAYDYPDKIKKLFLSGPAIIRKPKKNSLLVNLGRKVFSWPLVGKLRPLAYKLIGSPDYHRLQSEEMQKTFRNVIAEDLTHLLDKITIETHIFWGKYDTYTPFAQAEVIKESMPNCQLHVFEEAGHGLHLQEPLKLFNLIMQNL